MNPIDNPYNPGAGAPPPELAGRESVLKQAENTIKRTKNGKAAKSVIMLGLRGVGKTVLLNRIDQIAEVAGCRTAIFEADPNRGLPELLTQQLHRLLLKLDRRRRVSNEVQKAFGLLRGFASAFKVQFGEFEVGLSNETATGDLTIDLTDLIVAIGAAAKSRQTVAVIMIDEVQYVAKRDLSALIMALHKVSQRQLPLLFFGAGLPQLAKLAGDAKSYAERLFDYLEIDRLDSKSARAALVEPAKRESVAYKDDALDIILEETDGYPFFLQVWGSHVWEIAPSSPITSEHAKSATKRAIAALDKGFFKVRLDRLTDRQRKYAGAMAELGPSPATSTAVAKALGLTVKQAAPIRDEVIKKGMAYSPKRGLVAFTVPKFDEFMKRVVPGVRH
ncbi:MAG: ATP-binding protein [Thermodesulfobacteriota bacterium]|nr:ATP-binding protein [Thermodesulfobacteriota bacterium]